MTRRTYYIKIDKFLMIVNPKIKKSFKIIRNQIRI